MKSILKSVPLSKCRNKQAGDWKSYPNGTLVVKSACMSDWRSEVAVQTHELIEALRCQMTNIPDRTVTKFDAIYEMEREDGKHDPFDEAGDDPRAPYFDAHQRATAVEAAVCRALDLDWETHEANVNKLFE